jgi:hypothetical protein
VGSVISTVLLHIFQNMSAHATIYHADDIGLYTIDLYTTAVNIESYTGPHIGLYTTAEDTYNLYNIPNKFIYNHYAGAPLDPPSQPPPRADIGVN